MQKTGIQQNVELLSRIVDDWVAEERPVAQTPKASELQNQLDLQLEQQGCDIDVLEESLKTYLKYNPDVSQAGFYKLLYSGLNEPALLGDWVTSLGNATMHTYQVGPVATLMELELIRQWNRLIGFDNGDGVMVSGGSQANMIGMMLARHQACPDYKTLGGAGRTLVAFVSDQAHYSMQKAAHVLGIGTDNLIAVSSDENGQILPAELEQAVERSLAAGQQPFFIGLTAGTTVIGAFDPVAACSEIAKRYDLWLHIDGAWGGPVLFSDSYKSLLMSSGLADSFAWDAHKLMNVPITAAAILVKHAGVLKDCCSGGGGDYLFHNDENAAYNLGEKSIQCGRRADALKVWLSWKAVGHDGFANKIDYLQTIKHHCLQIIEQTPSLHLMAPAAYLNVLFRYQPDRSMSEQELRQLNIDICKTMMREGGPYVDYAQFKGKTGIRLILANQTVQTADVDLFLRRCVEVGERLSGS